MSAAPWTGGLALLLALAPTGSPVGAQVPQSAGDLLGNAIPYPRIHLAASRDRSQVGTPVELRANDPFLLYQLGRDLVNRQFTASEGAFGGSGELDVTLYADQRSVEDASRARFARGHAASCGTCHSSPYREPGGGQTIASTGGLGRSTTHFYGAGLIEMIGERVRQEILRRYDRDGDGLLTAAEVGTSAPVRIRPAPGLPPIDYGDLVPDAFGAPRLNSVFRVWYTDADGRVVPEAEGLDDPRVASFGLAMQPFGWGRGWRRSADGRLVSQGGEAASLREIFAFAADVHMGLQAFDPVQLRADGGGAGGVAGRSIHGALQFDFGHVPDRGVRRTSTGVSLDDPDGDGHVSELTAGDLDAVEFYLLHTPAPAETAPRDSEGRRLLGRLGCTRCHVERWHVPARDPERGLSGDRRLFRLETRVRPGQDGGPEISGRLIRLDETGPDGARPRGDAFVVEGIYTDFKHWDLGPEFHERRFDGTLQRVHRTAPLWGVGSTAPYGHSGRFATLDAAIAAHGGAAAPEARRYRNLPPARREALLAFLDALVLYSTDEIPVDLNGDGLTADSFQVAGQMVGYERFDARFLFRNPPRYRRLNWTRDPRGRQRPLALMENVTDAYGFLAPHRRDGDLDGFPDVLDPLPKRYGLGGTAP